MRRVLRSKLSNKNKVTAINTFAVSVILYPAAVVSWRREDLKETDKGTRKLMTIHGVFHPKSSTARLYTSRKEGGKSLHSIENVVRQESQSLKSYVSRKAESDPLMAECKHLIAIWKKNQMKLQPGMRSLCMVSDTKVCQKLTTWLAHINGSMKATSEETPRL